MSGLASVASAARSATASLTLAAASSFAAPICTATSTRWAVATTWAACARSFGAEIDLAKFEAAERSGGFGGIKMTGEPLPQCQFRVEPAYEHVGPAHECVNPGFFDCGEGEPRAFDLRDALA